MFAEDIDPAAAPAAYDYAYNLADDGTFIYWASSSDRIYRQPLVGGVPELVLAPVNAFGVAVVGDFLYWVEEDDGDLRRHRIAN